MKDKEYLWQPLPDFTHWYLAGFFGFGTFHKICHNPTPNYSYIWRDFASDNFLAEEASYSLYPREQLQSAAVAAIETALADFLAAIFPQVSYAHIRQTIAQGSITALPSEGVQEIARARLQQITISLLPEADREDFDANCYLRSYLTQLSSPINAVSVFLPVLYTTYLQTSEVYPSAECWREVRQVKRVETSSHKILPSMEKYGLKLVPEYSWHLELFTDKIRLGFLQVLQNILEPFFAHLKFFSSLHSAQLALYQHPLFTTDSGMYEEEKRTMTHIIVKSRQTPTETEGLMEQELVSMEQLTAWCRIQQPISAEGRRIAKHKVKISLPGPGLTGKALEERIERIRRQSRVLIAPGTAYAVAEEIRGRVQLLRQTMEEEQPEQQVSTQEKALSNQATDTKSQQSTRQLQDETPKVTRRPPPIHLNKPDLSLQQTTAEEPSPLQDSQDERAASLSRQDVPPAREQQPERYQPAAGYSRLGKDIHTGKYVDVPQASRRQGLYILGIQGYGKSGLMENLISQDIKQNIGVCVLDPHGELIDHVLARLPDKEKEKKVLLLDITDKDFFFGLNLFACADPANEREIQYALNQVTHVFEKAFGITHANSRVYDYLYNCAYTLIANPGSTMMDIRQLLTNDACRSKLLGNVTDAGVLDFWQSYYNPLPAHQQREESREILKSLNDLTHDPLRYIVGQSKTTIDFRQIMDERKIVLVKLDSLRLPSVTKLVGSLIIALVLNAAPTRTKTNLFNIYADEFPTYATEDFVTLIEQGRKRHIGLRYAHQNRGQLETILKDRLRSVDNLVVFKINSKDADELADEFDITSQEARGTDIHKQIAAELVNQDDHMARVRMKNADGKSVKHTIRTLKPEEGLQGKLLQERIARIQERNIQDGYVRNRAKVEEEIRQRQE